MSELRLKAHAKLNLHLRIGPPRPDGYHDLETVFHAIDLHDDLHLRLGDPGEGIHLTCDPPVTGTPEENLSYRAARAFLDQLPPASRRTVHLTLRKRIPTGGGLGGGSSDAAAVLLGLAHLFATAPAGDVPPHPSPGAGGRERLHGLARALGADVAFFLGPGAAMGRGIGDLLDPLPLLEALRGILILPPHRIPTGWAFQELDQLPAGEAASLDAVVEAYRRADLAGLGRRATNSFERVVAPRYPLHRTLIRSLEEAGALWARLTGSGSAVFGVFAQPPPPGTIEALARAHPDCAVQAFHGVERGVSLDDAAGSCGE